MNVTDSKQAAPWLADSAGMFASIACAIHCAAMPLAISYLPMLGLSWLADESFHRVMAVVCFALAVAAFVPGWRKHGSLLPAGIGSAGVAVIAVAAFALEGECCPSCAAAADESTSPVLAANPVLVANPVLAVSTASNQELVCADDECPHCLAAQAEQEQTGVSEAIAGRASVSEASPETEAAWYLPFVTPLGGVLLIAGHLVNHRKSCRCQGDGCCLPAASGAQVSGQEPVALSPEVILSGGEGTE